MGWYYKSRWLFSCTFWSLEVFRINLFTSIFRNNWKVKLKYTHCCNLWIVGQFTNVCVYIYIHTFTHTHIKGYSLQHYWTKNKFKTTSIPKNRCYVEKWWEAIEKYFKSLMAFGLWNKDSVLTLLFINCGTLKMSSTSWISVCSSLNNSTNL